MENIKYKKNSFNNSYKFPLMVLFLIIDLGIIITITPTTPIIIIIIITIAGLNSVLDYDKFNNFNVGQKASQLLLGLLGLQIVIEICVFLILFLTMADTFLFRVGLLGLLLKKFRSVLITHPIYITLTIVAGSNIIYSIYCKYYCLLLEEYIVLDILWQVIH